MTNPDPLRNIDEAADYLRQPVATLYYWRTKGGGPRFIKVGRRLLVRQSELDRYLDDLDRAQNQPA